MRVNLTKREPETVARWEESGLYPKMRETAAGRPKFIYHDGPPYANGELHAGYRLDAPFPERSSLTRIHQRWIARWNL